jgi:hypothetical protein
MRFGCNLVGATMEGHFFGGKCWRDVGVDVGNNRLRMGRKFL